MNANVIRIGKPYITHIDGMVNYCADILDNGTEKTMILTTDKKWEKYLLTERCDAFLWGALGYAMRRKQDIVCDASVTEEFLQHIRTMLIQTLCDHDARLHRVQITAEMDATPLKNAGGVATAISCGVDSLYSVSKHLNSEYKSMNLTHLYVGSSGSLSQYAEHDIIDKIHDRAEKCAKSIGLPIIVTRSNISAVLPQPFVPTHIFTTFFGILAFKKLLKIYYYPSTYDFSQFDVKNSMGADSCSFDLLSLSVLSAEGFRAYSQGAEVERCEKIREIADFKPAQEYLHVCSYHSNNCNVCAKCRNTLLALDMHGKLDQFGNVFDIKGYKEKRLDYFVWIYEAPKDPQSVAHARPLLRYFLKAEPDLMKQASKIVAERALAKENHDRIAVRDYDFIMFFYNFQTFLLEKESPEKFIEDFFLERSINDLVCVGDSRPGKIVINMLKQTSIKVTYFDSVNDVPESAKNILITMMYGMHHAAAVLGKKIKNSRVFIFPDLMRN